MNHMITPMLFPDEKNGSLAGHLLVATPTLADPFFTRSVIYMCNHNELGGMGVIINQPVQHVRMKEVFDQLNITPGDRALDVPIHFGGPVEPNRGFILHTNEYKVAGTIAERDGIAITANLSLIEDMAKGFGPRQSLLILGYSGWSPGQLESEIESGGWITTLASEHLIFHPDNASKWALATATLGFDMGHLSSVVGHA